MRIRISHPEVARDLIEALAAADCVAAHQDETTLEVVLPWLDGAAEADEARTELTFFLRAWELRNPGMAAALA